MSGGRGETDDGAVHQTVGQPVAFELIYVAYPSSLVLKSANALQTYNTLRELKRVRPDVMALLPRWGRRPSAFTALGARHLPRLPLNYFGRFWRTALWSYLERGWFAWCAALFLARRPAREPRVLYVRDAICAAWFGLGLAWVARARVIYEVHDLEQWNPSRATSRAGQPMVRLIDALAIRRADRVVALTIAFRRYLDRAGLKGLARTTVIPDAYDDATYHPLDRMQARQALNLSATAYTIVYAGLTFSYRGVATLVGAFARLRADLPDSCFLAVGGRERERAELAMTARELGVAAGVVLPGQRPAHEIPTYLAAADVLVLPGTVSGLNASPLKLFEYAAMERAIVAADTPALREILGDDGALYFAAGDEVALARALARVAADPAGAALRARRARARVAPFTYGARAEKILALSARVAAQRLAPTPGSSR